MRHAPALLALALTLALGAGDGLAETASGPRVLQLPAGSSVRLSSAALIVSDMRGGDLAVERTVMALPALDGRALVLVLASVESGALPPGDGPLDFEIVAYAFTADGEVTASSAADLRLERADLDRGLQLALALRLPPGDYRLRTLVRERRSGALDLAGSDLRIESAEGGGCAAWFLRSAAGWTLAVPDPETADLLRAEAEVAAALPSLTPGTSPTLRLVHPAGETIAADAAEIFDDSGTPVASAPLAIEKPAATIDGLEVLDPVVAVPDLAPGRYSLRLNAAAGQRPACADLDFAVPLPATSAVEPGKGPELEPGTNDRDRQALDERPYLAVLATLAAGDLARAAADLRAAEVAVQARLGDRGALRFSRAQQAVAERIARREPAALQALVLLHAERLVGYHAEDAKVLEADTAITLEAIARTWTRKGAPDRAASGALGLAGDRLQRCGWQEASERVFATALAVDPGNVGARLGAAAGREKAEDYRAVVELLAPLDDGASSSPTELVEEARLRLAINRIRVGEVEAGSRGLRRLADEARTPWISVLAFQELARASREPAERTAILDRGLARWPGENGLLLLSARQRERASTPAAGAALLRPLLADPAAEESARTRYNAWPRAPEVEPTGLRELERWLAGARRDE